MKQRINKLLFILFSCMLSACSNEDFGVDDSGMAGGDPMPVLIAGNQSVSTRVTETGLYFLANDRIGVFMKNSEEPLSTQSISEGVDNIEFRCTRSLSWIGGHFQQEGETIYYPHDGTQQVDFIAYYPYTPSITGYLYPIDVTNQPAQSQSSNELDILYSNDMRNISKKRDTTMLTFNHMMSRVQLLLQNEQGVAYDKTTAARITGLKRTAQLNLATGLIEQLGLEGDIQLTHSYSQVYRAFFIPQEASNSKVYITTNNDGILVYEFPSDMVFEAGKYYQYTITIKNKVELEVSQVTITDWDGKDEAPIEKTVTKYQVGDYYPDPDNASTAIGMVYEITDGIGYHGKIVDLQFIQRYGVRWGDSAVDENSTGVLGIREWADGETGTRNLIAMRKDQPGFAETYSAFNYIYQTKNGGNLNGMWYLPAVNEVESILHKKTLWQAKVVEAGYTTPPEVLYVTLSEYSQEKAYVVQTQNVIRGVKFDKHEQNWSLAVVAVAKF